jgi:hypothetical protein
LLSVLLLGTLRASAADATGSLELTCGFPYRYILEITNFRGHRLKQPIQFRLLDPQDFNLNRWEDSPGERSAEVSRIQMTRVYRLRRPNWGLSGNFMFVFADGRRMEGSFNAKYVEPRVPAICE